RWSGHDLICQVKVVLIETGVLAPQDAVPVPILVSGFLGYVLPTPAQGVGSRSGADYSFSRLASQSRDSALPSRSNSILPLMVSPVILPEYLVVNFWPFRSRVTVKDTSPS